MLSVSCDLGGLRDADVRFERAYRASVREMKTTLDAAADAARANHDYQNRTGDLTASTRASDVASSADGDEIIFGASMYYAVFVDRRGLMTVVEQARQAETALRYLFDGLATAL